MRSGPPRDENALRRRDRTVDRSGFTHLPAAGRDEDPPSWPLPGRMTKFERETWEREWRRPQALEWERRGLELQVALYVRTLRMASGAKARGCDMTSARSLQNDLGLSVAGLAANHWVIDNEPAAPVSRRAPTATAKDRLTVLKGGSNAAAS